MMPADDGKKIKSAAVVLAAGRGRRMGTDTAKQFLILEGRPVIYYSLKAFEESDVDEVILVTGSREEDFCREQIVEKYGFKKVMAVVAGGAQRYHSVAAGLEAFAKRDEVPEIVMIHDGARPFVTKKLINGLLKKTMEYPACVTGTPVADTIKTVDENDLCTGTPDRRFLWAAATPQSFDFSRILSAYRSLLAEEEKLLAAGVSVTDDAGVFELYDKDRVLMVMGDPYNRKLTTPEDMAMAGTILKLVSENG